MDASKIGGSPSIQQYQDKTTQPEKQEAPPPEIADSVQINVPIAIPKEMMVPGKDGKRPIDDFEVQLIPKGAVVTNQGEIQDLVAQVREQTLPEGMKADVADSPAGIKVAKGKQVVGQLAQMAGGFGLMNLMGSNPASWAGPAAIAGGVIGGVNALDQLKKGFDMKAYYEGMKAKGQETIQIPVQQKDGTVINQEVKIDDLIRGAKDSVVVSGLQALGSALTAGAGMGGGPMLAMASMAVQIGALLFAARHAIAAVAKKVGTGAYNKAVAVKEFVKETFSKKEAAKVQVPDSPQISTDGSAKVKTPDGGEAETRKSADGQWMFGM